MTMRLHSFKVKSHVFVVPTHYKPTDTQPLGSGAYAVVAGAKDQRDGRAVAIKRISDVFLKDPVPAKRCASPATLTQNTAICKKRSQFVVMQYTARDFATAPSEAREHHRHR
jgi:hypothetical protein